MESLLLYAAPGSLFFLIFGTLILRLFGVPLSMVRIVGGIILMKIGFELFSPSPSGGVIPFGGAGQGGNIAFVPLAKYIEPRGLVRMLNAYMFSGLPLQADHSTAGRHFAFAPIGRIVAYATLCLDQT
jgi:hypothetical protein